MRPASANEVLQFLEIPAFLITDLTNIRYITGVPVTAGYVLLTPKRTTFFVDDRYRLIADRRSRKGITVRDVSTLVKTLAEIPECGFEEENVTVGRKLNWKRYFKNTKFIHKRAIFGEYRRSKEAEELAALRKAYRITQELLRRVPSALRKGITEEKLARQLNIWALEIGAEGLAFDPIVAFGTHTSSPHHHPTSRKLQKGHLVQIDVGAKVKGYHADASAVYFTGKPTAEQKLVYEAVSAAKDSATDAVKAGASTHELDRIARRVLKAAGVEKYFCHALGHGVGLEIHEGVTISQKAPEEKLLKNEVITIEPGVYLPGRFGMRIEEMVFVS